ncbi:MAG TPA: CHAT domain-containing protein [Polyangiaceae bacterium]|nr:CHAT domain-containing protein [Polyangiaceae bacterium]
MASGKILFFAANPLKTVRLELDKEARDIEAKIRASDHRDFFSLKTRWAATADDLLQALLEDKPGAVHFSGHGKAEPAGIVLHGESGGHQFVKADALKRLFKAVGGNVRVVVLNACYSEPQARAIAEVVDCVVGMKTAIGDEAACKFAASFYRGLGFGGSVQDAFEQGLVAISLHNLGEESVPQLLVKKGVKAKEVILVPDPR